MACGLDLLTLYSHVTVLTASEVTVLRQIEMCILLLLVLLLLLLLLLWLIMITITITITIMTILMIKFKLPAKFVDHIMKTWRLKNFTWYWRQTANTSIITNKTVKRKIHKLANQQLHEYLDMWLTNSQLHISSWKISN